MEFAHIVNAANLLYKKTLLNIDIMNEYAWRVWVDAFSDVLPPPNTRPWIFSEARLREDIRNLHTLSMPLDYANYVIANFKLKRMEFEVQQQRNLRRLAPMTQASQAPKVVPQEAPKEAPKEAPNEIDPLDSSSVRFSLLELF